MMRIFALVASVGMGTVSAGSSGGVQQLTEDAHATKTVAGTSSFARFFDQERLRKIFPDALELYNFNSLVSAATKYPQFANSGNDVYDKRELAAFLAQTAYESSKFMAAEEFEHESYSAEQYCNSTTYPCAPGRHYHGRGPVQLSWNYNYVNAGKALGIDLLQNPDIVATDSKVAWATALWFWMTSQGNHAIHDVVAGVNGFAISTRIINGHLECGPNAPDKSKELERAKFYTIICEAMDVQPLGDTSCNA